MDRYVDRHLEILRLRVRNRDRPRTGANWTDTPLLPRYTAQPAGDKFIRVISGPDCSGLTTSDAENQENVSVTCPARTVTTLQECAGVPVFSVPSVPQW